ncbi:MAG: ribonuclease Z, partial [Clostridiales bacterium]|nr:ribonuclease Z [Clostridiales bacterium]
RVIVPYLPYEIKIIENPRDTITLIENISISTLELDHSAPCLGYSFYFKRKASFDLEAAIANKVPKILWNKLQKGESLIYEGNKYEPNMVLGRERRGIKFSLITDTRPIKEIIDFIKESDLLICEGTYGDDKDIEKAIKNKHMTFSEAAKLARDGRVRDLMLTHFSPAMNNPEEYIENARKIFENTVLGEDRIIKTLSFIDY